MHRMDPLPIDPSLREIALGLGSVAVLWLIVQIIRASGNGTFTFRWGRRRNSKPGEDE
jgi:hypothetical protein